MLYYEFLVFVELFTHLEKLLIAIKLCRGSFSKCKVATDDIHGQAPNRTKFHGIVVLNACAWIFVLSLKKEMISWSKNALLVALWDPRELPASVTTESCENVHVTQQKIIK